MFIIIFILFISVLANNNVYTKIDKVNLNNNALTLELNRQKIEICESTLILKNIEIRLHEVEKWQTLAQAFQDSIIVGKVLKQEGFNK